MSLVTITIANHKGGVGKTTTAITLATGLASQGHPVVLIDCDPQGNVASYLGLEVRRSFYELIIMEKKPKEILQTVPRLPTLGIVASNADTRAVEFTLNQGLTHKPATAIANAIQVFNGTQRRTTYIVIDTAPSLSALQVSALAAADWLIIPTSPEYGSEIGIRNLMSGVQSLKQEGGKVEVLGILPTMVDERCKEHVETLTDLRQHFNTAILPRVRRLISLAEAPREGVPIWLYGNRGEAAIDYGAVLAEVIKRIGAS